MIEAAVGAAAILAAGAALVARRVVRRRIRRHDTGALTDRALLNAVQTGVLPVAPPTIDGVRIDASYRMAGSVGGPIGGDFYVFVPFEDGTVGIGVGDVAGHGPAAVAAMANARLTLRAIASVTPDPSVALNRTEFVLRRTGTLDFLSVLYGVLDPLNGTWTQVNAGHCPPILKRCDGSTTLLAGASATVLGASTEATAFESSQMGVEPGDVLVLYTDGLVERRDASIDVGIERVCEIIRRHTDMSTLTGALMSSVGVEPADDVAIVVVEMGDVPQPAIDLPASPGRRYLRRPTHVHARPARDGELVQTPLGTWVATSQDWIMTTETSARHLIPYRTFRDLYVEDDEGRMLVRHDRTDQARAHQRFAPDPESVPAARRFVRSWLRGAEVDVDEDAVALLTTELASNAVTHARSVFEVEVETSSSSIRVGVHDQNRHNIRVLAPRPDEPSGRGLSIVASLAKDWGCDVSPSGKTVWFELERDPDSHDSVSGP